MVLNRFKCHKLAVGTHSVKHNARINLTGDETSSYYVLIRMFYWRKLNDGDATCRRSAPKIIARLEAPSIDKPNRSER